MVYRAKFSSFLNSFWNENVEKLCFMLTNGSANIPVKIQENR